VVYNLHRAKEAIHKEDRVILVEGYMDAIGVTAAGFRAVVASCGTALTAHQVQVLKRHSQKISVNFDPDAPGANAAERSIGLLLEEGMQIRIVELDGELDPDEYCKERGAAAYQQRLDAAKGYFFWLADRARKNNDMRTPEGKVGALKALLPAVGRISDRLERMAIANEVAGYIAVERGLVLDSFLKAAADRQEKSFQAPSVALRPDERILLNGLLALPEIRGEVIAALKSTQAAGTFPSRHVFQAIFALDEAGGPFSFEGVIARLEESDRNLLAQVAFTADAAISREEVMAALRRVSLTDEQNRVAQTRARIRELERAGNIEEALRLMAELPRLSPPARNTGSGDR
jgi:DNA primase